ncbi:MAG TPA: hypothetical protein VF799_03655 [Geobacteraceae bacterium]
MKLKAMLVAVVLAFSVCGSALDAGAGSAEEEARQAFLQILDLWRAEQYEALFSRLSHPPEQGWDYFAGRIVYASRIPACCWEMLQDVQVTVLGPDEVGIHAKVGLEIEGVGTRFVTRDFVLRRVDGIWKLPMRDVLDLSRYDLQRIPRQIYERAPD